MFLSPLNSVAATLLESSETIFFPLLWVLLVDMMVKKTSVLSQLAEGSSAYTGTVAAPCSGWWRADSAEPWPT